MRITLASSCMAFLARVTESRQYWMIYLVSLYRDIPALVRLSLPVGADEQLHSQGVIQEIDLFDHCRGGDESFL